MMTNRLEWVDITKCLAILLMIIGHSSIPEILSNFIYAFHMPTFFILSGMCTDWHKDSIANFVKRRIKSLLLPFLIYSLIVILISQWSDLYLFSLTNGWRGYALWFVPVFMLALIMSKLYFTITNGVFRIIFFVLLILTASYLSYSGTHLPWSISSVPYSAILVISGYYLKRFADYITKLRIVYIILSMAIVAAISYFFSFRYCVEYYNTNCTYYNCSNCWYRNVDKYLMLY